MKSLSLSEAINIIKSGGIIAYPTETFYGLGVDPRNSKALERLFKVKERDRGKPISILVGSQENLTDWVTDIGPEAQVLIEKFWPGPLTLVLKAAATVSPLLIAGTGSLGVRISPHPMASHLAQTLGAITTTSANISGAEPIRDPKDLQEMLGKRVYGFVDGGILNPSKGSTIISVLGNSVKVIREGEVDKSKVISQK